MENKKSGMSILAEMAWASMGQQFVPMFEAGQVVVAEDDRILIKEPDGVREILRDPTAAVLLRSAKLLLPGSEWQPVIGKIEADPTDLGTRDEKTFLNQIVPPPCNDAPVWCKDARFTVVTDAGSVDVHYRPIQGDHVFHCYGPINRRNYATITIPTPQVPGALKLFDGPRRWAEMECNEIARRSQSATRARQTCDRQSERHGDVDADKSELDLLTE